MCGCCYLGFICFSKFIYGVQCALPLLYTPLQYPFILFGLEILITAVWPTFFFFTFIISNSFCQSIVYSGLDLPKVDKNHELICYSNNKNELVSLMK
jgi:hypothetical protein